MVGDDGRYIVIPEGPLWMGDDRGRDDERPVHRVWVDAFAMDPYAVTNDRYATFVAATNHEPPLGWEHVDLKGPQHPVAGVSWYDCVEYCRWLSQHGKHEYRLPTEAEREKAARGGREHLRYPWGNEAPPAIGRFATGKLLVRGTVPVDDDDHVNGFGLYHMGDNLHEWCSDWYNATYYTVSPERNPDGPKVGDARASRGGSWRHHMKVCTCAARSSIPPDRRFTDYGFRVVYSL